MNLRDVKAKVGDIVLVEWRDARSADRWTTLKAFMEDEEFQRCLAVGRIEVLAYPDLVIAADWDELEKSATFGRLLAVPFGIISKITRLKRMTR